MVSKAFLKSMNVITALSWGGWNFPSMILLSYETQNMHEMYFGSSFSKFILVCLKAIINVKSLIILLFCFLFVCLFCFVFFCLFVCCFVFVAFCFDLFRFWFFVFVFLFFVFCCLFGCFCFCFCYVFVFVFFVLFCFVLFCFCFCTKELRQVPPWLPVSVFYVTRLWYWDLNMFNKDMV